MTTSAHGALEVRRAAAVASRRWVVLAALLSCEFVVELDTSIVNIALPTLGRDLGASISQLQWVVDAYIMILAPLLLFTGGLVDRFGGRRILFTGVSLFAAGSALAALAATANQIIATRAVMGLAAALILPATLFILSDVFPAEERGKAFSVWSVVAGLSFALGPMVGGWLVEEFGWAAIFWINLPIIAVAVVVAAPVLPGTRSTRPVPIDAVGVVLATAGVAALLYAVIQAPERGWLDDVIVGGFGFSAVLLTGFVIWERRIRLSFIGRRLLGDRRLLFAGAALALIFLPVAGALFILTQYLQVVLGYSPIGAGLRMLPVALVFAVAAAGSVSVSERIGDNSAIALGLLLLAASGGCLIALSALPGYDMVLASLLIGGAGMGIAVTPAMNITLSALPVSGVGVGSALNTTSIHLGGALGVAVLGSIMASRFADLARTTFGSSFSGSVAEAFVRVTSAGPAARVAAGALRDDFVRATTPAFVAGTAIAAGGAVVAWACLPRRTRSDPA